MLDPQVKKEIYNAVLDACTYAVEAMPAIQERIAMRDKLLKEIEGKVSRDTASQIRDLYIDLTAVWGMEMYELGWKYGRNPAAIFEDSDNKGGAA